MCDVFINYRTNDELATANLLNRDLSARFGSNKIFFASKSIDPGDRFEQALLRAVGRSQVLLAVIGSRWLTATNRTGGKALTNPADWTRREILEAFKLGIPVVPILVERTGNLRKDDLPRALAPLASCQSLRLSHRNADADLDRIADQLLRLVPELRPEPGPVTTHQAGSHRDPHVPVQEPRSHRRGGVGNILGNVNNLVTDPRGPVHTGTGDQYNRADGPQ